MPFQDRAGEEAGDTSSFGLRLRSEAQPGLRSFSEGGKRSHRFAHFNRDSERPPKGGTAKQALSAGGGLWLCVPVS